LVLHGSQRNQPVDDLIGDIAVVRVAKLAQEEFQVGLISGFADRLEFDLDQWAGLGVGGAQLHHDEPNLAGVVVELGRVDFIILLALDFGSLQHFGVKSQRPTDGGDAGVGAVAERDIDGACRVGGDGLALDADFGKGLLSVAESYSTGAPGRSSERARQRRTVFWFS
jgi:hypothetical protein